ncbi:MAG: 4Fe-4S dicluster domain-containing protein, partial [Kiritimatiellae bacterium]|nr:4Fe-4S dicluster domain-containing protein [Kiritimatiellia bacterium]
IDGALNVFMSRDDANKAVASSVLGTWQGAVNVAWPDAQGWNALTATIAARGKVTVTGTLANGAKVNAKSQLVVGEGWCCVPVVYAKRDDRMAFNMWLPKAVTSTALPSSQEGITRRDTLKGVAFMAAAEVVEKTTDGGYSSVTPPGVPPRTMPVLPPGSVDRREFNLKCVGCGLCIANCSGGCLKASTALTRLGQPEMDFRHDYCLVRCAQQCAKVCPAGAIRLLDGVARREIHVGHAVWRRNLCIRETEDVKCTACSRKCPVGAIRIVEGFPVVDKEACIGCGACEHVCPARPMPAIFVEGLAQQRVSCAEERKTT